MYIFETKIFEFTGTNIVIGFFRRKNYPKTEIQEFIGTKFKKLDNVFKREYFLNPRYNYRGGSEYDEFCEEYKAKNPLQVKYYIQREDVLKNKGNYEINVIDTSNYISNEYLKTTLYFNEEFSKKVKSNILYVRTVDTGSYEGRAGLYYIKENFNVAGVYVSGNTYRTSPIHVFLDPPISNEDQSLLREYFNYVLEHFRNKLDSEFLTTYKYSNAKYTRKYLGLTQVRKIIETFPFSYLNSDLRNKLKDMIKKNKYKEILNILKNYSERKSKKVEDITKWF